MLIKSKYKPKNIIVKYFPNGAAQICCLMTYKTLDVIGAGDHQEREIERWDRKRAEYIRNHPVRIIT
jgi:hypothetical protein